MQLTLDSCAEASHESQANLVGENDIVKGLSKKEKLQSMSSFHETSCIA